MNGKIIQNILRLQDVIIMEQKKNGNSKYMKRFDKILDLIKGVGIIDKLVLNGSYGRYLVIDGKSWKGASEELKIKEVPDYVMWEENEFITLLQNQLNGKGIY
jgi:ParB-like chromosome segregation protein Spo0J